MSTGRHLKVAVLGFLAVACLVGDLPLRAAAADAGDVFVPSCRDPAPGFAIRDPEFNKEDFWVAWRTDPELRSNGTVRRHGKLYVAPVDPLTGDFLMDERQQVRGAKPLGHAVQNGASNGPEWGNSQRGWEIYYSCYSPDEETSRLCRVRQDGAGNWSVRSALPKSRHKILRQPSKNPADRVPKLYYQSVDGNVKNQLEGAEYGWRMETRNPENHTMPDEADMGRWTPDATLFIHQTTVGLGASRIKQLAKMDVSTGEITLLFDDGQERLTTAAVWNAPELGGETAISALVPNSAGGLNTEIYRPDGNGSWALWSVIEPIDPAYPINYSVEAFVFAGRSYVSVVSYEEGFRTDSRGTPSIVWVASVDPTLTGHDHVRRIVSQEYTPGSVSIKLDPEPALLAPGSGVRIYYVDRPKGHDEHVLRSCDAGF